MFPLWYQHTFHGTIFDICRTWPICCLGCCFSFASLSCDSNANASLSLRFFDLRLFCIFSADIVKQTRKRKNCDDSPRHSLVLCANLIFFSLLDCRSWILLYPVVSELTFLRPSHFFLSPKLSVVVLATQWCIMAFLFSQRYYLLLLQAVSISEWGSEGMSTRKIWLTKIVWELTELNKIYMGDEMSQQQSWQKWWKSIELTKVEVDRTEG